MCNTVSFIVAGIAMKKLNYVIWIKIKIYLLTHGGCHQPRHTITITKDHMMIGIEICNIDLSCFEFKRVHFEG